MAQKLLLSAIGVSFLALVSTIVGLSTSKWMEGCVQMTKLSIEKPNLDESNSKKMLNDKNMCVFSGLFWVGMGAGRFGFANPVPFHAMGHFMQASAIMLISGSVFTAAGIYIIARNWYMYNKKMSKARKNTSPLHPNPTAGFVCLIFACLSLGAGILSYTLPQLTTVHNSRQFLKQVEDRCVEMIWIFNHGSTDSSYLGSPDVSESIDYINDIESDDSLLNLHGFEENDLPDPETQSGLLLLHNLDPIFSYSFYFAWTGFLCILSACFLVSIEIVRKKETHNHNSCPRLV